jgi:hypothetical protein
LRTAEEVKSTKSEKHALKAELRKQKTIEKKRAKEKAKAAKKAAQ